MRTAKVFGEAWPLYTPLVVAQGDRSETHVAVIELEEEGIEGTDECTSYPRYRKSGTSVMVQIMSVMSQLGGGLAQGKLQKIFPTSTTRNTLDCTLQDLTTQRQQQLLADLIGITPPETTITAQTVVIGMPDQMASSVSTLQQTGARLLRVKLDNHFISERMVAVHTAAFDTTLIVDASES